MKLGTTKNSHIGHCTHTMESANVISKGKGKAIPLQALGVPGG
jgi:hypothetical protein